MENNKSLKIGLDMPYSSAWKTRCKFWNIESDEKKACIPRLIWNDGHAEWSRWYYFKDQYNHMCAGQYVFK